MMVPMRALNLHQTAFEYDDKDPPGYRCGAAQVGRQLEAQETSVKWFEIPPGESLCPYHYEYVEEWLLVMEGEVVVRVPAGEEAVGAGSLVRFPVGPGGAHKLTNRSEQPARVLMWSSSREPALAVYPDSDKIGAWSGEEADSFMFRRADGQVDYYDGET
jgi:uncharacterized cupin superfamily protein